MAQGNSVYIGKGESVQALTLKRANRHGLIAGATGTGKNVTLQILAEGFSAQGVPVFMADVKGDLSGMSQAGAKHEKLEERARKIGFDEYSYRAFPTVFWDLYGAQGHAVRATISDMGPLLLSRLLDLNETQEGVLNIAFRIADEQQWLLLDLKDLRAMLVFLGENSSAISVEYGNVSKASIGAIQRRLLTLENQGADKFFGEPQLALADLMRTDTMGYGHINILAANELMQYPKLYSTFLLWLLSELFEELPEVGDPDKPKLVFFFDEAHLLFDDAPKALLNKIEQVVRLIRSKGIGIYFVTQNPIDIPDEVLGQLGNRVQHALRAYTPRDKKAVRVAATTFRNNPNFDAETAITELGVGEALVSTLDEKGVPTMVERTLVRPPSSRLGPATAEERARVVSASPFGTHYDTTVDRESAYEKLKARAGQAAKEEAERKASDLRFEPPPAKKKSAGRRSGRQRQGMVEAMAKSMLRSVGTSLGRSIVRGLLGSFLKR